MAELKKFIREEARTLPIILLLDRSGSMCGENIDTLNDAVKIMIKDFADETGMTCEIKVAIVSFGGMHASVDVPLTSAIEIAYAPLLADGMTPLGDALKKAKELIEDRSIITPRSYRPVVILASDGLPNDAWEEIFEKFISEGRTKKCERWALAIGNGCDEQMLQKFVGKDSEKLFRAQDAGHIKQFFRMVTMSTVTKTKSQNPNLSVNISDMNELVGDPEFLAFLENDGIKNDNENK